MQFLKKARYEYVFSFFDREGHAAKNGSLSDKFGRNNTRNKSTVGQ